VKLLDFGVSKMIVPPLEGRDDEMDLTRTGMVMGTPYYMAPEQARGDRNLDARVDLYACGVILYEALTGRRPFTAANYNALLLQILSTTPRPAREIRPALPSGFDAVLDKAMARSRDDRYRNAAELQRDLQTLRDRHNGAPLSLGDAARASGNARGGTTSGGGVRSLRGEPPVQAPRGQTPRATPEPTPSSVEIPIVFSGETPQSGESLPIDDRDLLDDLEGAAADDGQVNVGVAADDGQVSVGVPADDGQVNVGVAADDGQVSVGVPADDGHVSVGVPADDGRGSDAYTTQKRGAEFARELANAREAVRDSVRDTDVTGRPAVRDTEPTGRPAVLGRRKGHRARASNPEDTLPDDSETGEPTQLMPARVRRALGPYKPPRS
jgi:hypothetical protein